MTKEHNLTTSPPTSDEFTKALGQITWLMTVSKDHRDKPTSWIETQICAPLMFRQVRVFVKDKRPLAALTWAYASDDLQSRLRTAGHIMSLQDWRCGSEVSIVECISALGNSQPFIDQFMAEVATSRDAKNNIS
ncbi:toxin-activating lysine-acyltransferase [Epibacterium ulvae]